MLLSGRSFAVKINVATLKELTQEVTRRFAAREGFALATINLDHVTKLETDTGFCTAYQEHDIIVADGNPIVWLSKLAKTPVDLLPGSELVVPLTRLAATAGAPIALVGSSDASLKGAAQTLQRLVPEAKIVLSHAPAYGFDPTGPEACALLERIHTSGAQLVFIALGAPKQELFAALGRTRAPQAGFASIGAGLDFLSGTQTRAPKWVRRLALEWLWRLLHSPKRLFKRYALCALALPGLALRAFKQRGNSA